MQIPQNRSDQVEWFHAIAAAIDAGTLGVSPVTLTYELANFIAVHLPGHRLPPSATEAEFVEAVRTLRESEKIWNQHLMQALVDANESAKAGSPQTATKILETFADSCPWALFSKVAKGQASQFHA